MPWATGSTRQDLCFAAVLGGPLLALGFTIMRFFDRWKAGLGWDDYLIGFASVLLIAIIYPSWQIIEMLHYGIHLWEVDPLVLVKIDYNEYHHLTLVFSFLSGLIMPLVKISILLLLLKIGSVFDNLRKAIWVFIVLSIINCIIVQMLLLFQCPQKPDDTAADRTFGGLSCIDRKMLGRINIYQAIFNMSTDLFVFPIPVYIAYKMRMASLKDRLMVVFLFSLGLLVTVIGAIRVYLVYEERVFIKSDPDWTWALTPVRGKGQTNGVTEHEQNSKCWLEAKVRFKDRIRKVKHPPSQENIDDFLRNNVNVNKAISEAEKLKEKADRRYEGSLGKLLGVLSVLKDVGDSVLTCAPETISIAWGIISFLVGIGVNDMDNCGQISEASTNIVTIILNCRLYENRHDAYEGKTEMADLAGRVMESIKELITVILEFFWHASRRFREDNKLKKFCDIFSIRSTANEKYEHIIRQYKDLRNMARVEFEDNVIGWLQDLKNDNAKLAEWLSGDNEKTLRTLLLPELHDIRDKLEGLQEDVKEIKLDVKTVKVDVKEIAGEVVMFRHETQERDLERKAKAKLEKRCEELKSSDPHLKQLASTLDPLRRRLGTSHLSRWLFSHDHYQAWERGDQKFLYLKGQPGFGKSVTMAVAIERLRSFSNNSVPSLHGEEPYNLAANTEMDRLPVIFFFFRRGDDDTQLTGSALSCLVAQLFHLSMHEHVDTIAKMEKLVAVLEADSKLDPHASKGMDEDKAELAGDYANSSNPDQKKDQKSSKVDSDLLKIKRLAAIIQKTVYIIIDGIDECTDYQKTNLVARLIELGRSKEASFKILMSSRGGLGLERFFLPENLEKGGADLEDRYSDQYSVDSLSEDELAPMPTPMPIPFGPPENKDPVKCVVYGDAAILTVTKSANEEDMKAYLEDSLTELLDQGSTVIGMSNGRDAEKSLGSNLNRKQTREIKAMVDGIQKKAEGMFTYSAMVIASLKQPSPLSIKQRVKQLPDQMDSLYARHLESLTTAQRKLVLLALKRVVFATADMSTLEIVEEFKEEYLKTSDGGDSDDSDDSTDEDDKQADRSGSPETENDLEDPEDRAMRKPEIIYTIRHLEIAGREFFKFSHDKRSIDVIHKSVRDWVEKEAEKAEERFSSQLAITDIVSWGNSGEIKITLPKHFVEGHSASTEFESEKDVNLDMLLYFLKVLTNKRFQERHMPMQSVKILPEEDIAKAGDRDPEVPVNEPTEVGPSAPEPRLPTPGPASVPLPTSPTLESVASTTEPTPSIPEPRDQPELISSTLEPILSTQVPTISTPELTLSMPESPFSAPEPTLSTPEPTLSTSEPVLLASESALPAPDPNDSVENQKDSSNPKEDISETDSHAEQPSSTAEANQGDEVDVETLPPKLDHWRGEVLFLVPHIRMATATWPLAERRGPKWNQLKDLFRKFSDRETFERWYIHRFHGRGYKVETEVPPDKLATPGHFAGDNALEIYLDFLIEDEQLNYDFETDLQRLRRTIYHTEGIYYCPEQLEKIMAKTKLDNSIEDNIGYTPPLKCLSRINLIRTAENATRCEKLGKSFRLLLNSDPKPDLNKLMPGVRGVPIHTLCRFQDLQLLEDTLERLKPDLNLDLTDSSGLTALHTIWFPYGNYSADFQAECGQKLLEAGADPNTQDLESNGPLFYAVACNNLRGVELLLQHGAEVNDDNTAGVTALISATADPVLHSDPSEEKTISIMKLLWKAGADPTIRSKSGLTALMAAVSYDKLELAKVLLEFHEEHGSRLTCLTQRNLKEATLLHVAADFGEDDPSVRAAKFVMENLTIDSKEVLPFLKAEDFRGRTALYLTLTGARPNPPLAAYLIEGYYKYSKLQEEPLETLWLPKFEAIRAFENDKFLEILKSGSEDAKEAYAYLIGTEPYRTWILHAAISCSQELVLEELSKLDIDLFKLDDKGWDAFDWAYACGHEDLMKTYFPDQTASIDYSSRRSTWRERFQPITEWDQGCAHELIEVCDDGLTAKVDKSHEAQPGNNSAQAYAVSSKFPISPYQDVFYYEISILDAQMKERSELAIGFSSEAPDVRCLPGWPSTKTSIGYHGDSGSLLMDYYDKEESIEELMLTMKPEDYGVGDTVGCGYNQVYHTLLFTLNGRYLGDSVRDVRERLYPLMGGIGWLTLKANFGHSRDIPFMWKGETRSVSSNEKIDPEAQDQIEPENEAAPEAKSSPGAKDRSSSRAKIATETQEEDTDSETGGHYEIKASLEFRQDLESASPRLSLDIGGSADIQITSENHLSSETRETDTGSDNNAHFEIIAGPETQAETGFKTQLDRESN
ncbi:hypothetical protein Dda_7180 [Drechslerella dactyloides]|uniref:B30.2/SPRY domain-containing protein n=1 Tax=Drechslerella dactyloides TaxID=74499 RepID=A0AAD6ITT2_DREDA|nr:hypothetical protein Dda_7180 [Drechslerella dactyloides]